VTENYGLRICTFEGRQVSERIIGDRFAEQLQTNQAHLGHVTTGEQVCKTSTRNPRNLPDLSLNPGVAGPEVQPDSRCDGRGKVLGWVESPNLLQFFLLFLGQPQSHNQCAKRNGVAINDLQAAAFLAGGVFAIPQSDHDRGIKSTDRPVRRRLRPERRREC